MEIEQALGALRANSHAVLTTLRRDGHPQLSNVPRHMSQSAGGGFASIASVTGVRRVVGCAVAYRLAVKQQQTAIARLRISIHAP